MIRGPYVTLSDGMFCMLTEVSFIVSSVSNTF